MLYVFLRLSAFFIAVNVIFPSGTPKTFKLSFTLVLSVMVSTLVDVDVVANNMVELIRYSIIETLTGLILGYMVMLCFNILKFVGSLMDFQVGLSMASMYDINTQTNSTLIDRLMYWLGVVVFFTINGHHTLIIGMVESFHYIAIGDTVVLSNIGYVIETFTKLFSIGFKIALPFILTLLLTELLMGLVSRSVPSFNVMMVGMPIKMLVGIILLIVIMPSILNEIVKIMNSMSEILRGTFL